MAVAATLAIVLVLLVIFAVILALVERYFARKDSLVSGMVLPAMFFLASVVSIVGSLPSVVRVTIEHGISGILSVLLMYVIVFILLNLPTALTYFVYYRERRKMGEIPWPMSRKKKQ